MRYEVGMNILITGASRGIGLELCRQALAKGHTVIAVVRTANPDSELGRLKEQSGDKLQIINADMSDFSAPQAVLQQLEGLSSVDVLINNAGILKQTLSGEDFAESFRVNTIAPFLMAQAFLPLLKKSKAPKLINISSMMGSVADNTSGGYYPYRSSKAALNMINKSLSVDNPWLTTVVMHPGWVKTDMGGAGATTEIKESVQGMWTIIEKLKLNDSGGFFNFKGEELPW